VTDRRTSGFRELEETVQGQAARIDELTRTCASLVEDNKAFRQRVEREKDRVLEAEKSRLAQVLLETHDGLELAYRSSEPGPGPAPAAALRDLREGVRLTLAALEKRIGELGVGRLEVVGLPYDARTAEAIDLVPVDDEARDGVVVEELRSGWRAGDRVLRPARVRVGRLARA
jgi:molecular chaperone GrpE